jgi:hypothetical protein
MIGAGPALSADGRGVDFLLAASNDELAPFAAALGL